MSPPTILFDGNYLRLVQKDGWQYVERPNVTGVVAIIAVTDERKIVLVEQDRIPLGRSVIELPAGLVGDSDSSEDVLTAARREMLEETGYDAAELNVVGTGAPSAGLTNEVVTFVRAQSLTKVTAGG